MDQQPQFDLRPAMTASHGQQHPTAGGPGSHGQGEYAVPGAGTTGSSATGSHRDESAVSKPIRRRMRMITSCLECRRRKLRCDKAHPCHNCVRFQRECVYLGPKLDEASQLRLTELKEKVGSLERQLERDVAKGTAARRGGDGSDQRSFLSHGGEDEYDEDRDLEITPMVALDLTYDDSSDGNGADELVDLGVRVGRMRITERIGGLNRPRLSEEVCTSTMQSTKERKKKKKGKNRHLSTAAFNVPHPTRYLMVLTPLRYKPGFRIAKSSLIGHPTGLRGLARPPNRRMFALPTSRIFSGLGSRTSPRRAASSLGKQGSRCLCSICSSPRTSGTCWCGDTLKPSIPSHDASTGRRSSRCIEPSGTM